jgi:hypothetical protein
MSNANTTATVSVVERHPSDSVSLGTLHLPNAARPARWGSLSLADKFGQNLGFMIASLEAVARLASAAARVVLAVTR